jgi:N-acetylglucosaminyldiphosphoundecaprenol N-acetyl-beta-D-mannosaminyltransferase
MISVWTRELKHEAKIGGNAVLPEVCVHGMRLAAVGESELLQHVESSLNAGSGGWLVTANLDVLWHFVNEPAARDVYSAADLRVADGMPLVWAARLQGDELPGRVAGSSLCDPLLVMCERNGWPIALLGGQVGAAERVAELYRGRFTRSDVVANSALHFSVPPTPSEISAALAIIERSGARVVLVGLGSPKQEYVIQRLRAAAPTCWFIGVGGSFNFLAGETPRAPELLQRAGLEWLHRLANDPRRLARRYLKDDLPLALRLLSRSAWLRLTRRDQRSEAKAR